MTPFDKIILAVLMMILLTLTVGILLLYRRVIDMKRLRILPNEVATSHSKNEILKDSRASDNYNNQFELPIIFYVLVLVILFHGNASNLDAYFSLTFVASRYIHSTIQCTYNNVMHRFSIFLFGYLVVTLMLINIILSFSS